MSVTTNPAPSAYPDTAEQADQVRPADTSPEALAALTARLAASAEHYDRTADFPWEPLGELSRAGILTLGVGPRYGGRDLTATESAKVLQALGHGDPSVALLAAMTIFQHLQQARKAWWPEDLYRTVLADSRTRPVLINAVRAEPELGAPARGGLPATKVRRTAHGWLLNGHKGYGTGSEGLAYHAVWAATEDEDPLLGHVIVPGDHPGVEVVRTWDHFGLRASSTHDVIYRDVEVPEEHFRGVPASQAAEQPAAYAGAGIAVSALYLGVARAAQEFFLRFAHERVPTSLGRPIATTERIQTIAGEIEAQLIQAEEIVYGLAARIDAGDPEAARRALIAKLLVTRSAVSAVQATVTSLGNPGLTRHHPLERHLRDVQCSRVHPPQDDAALLAIGKQALARAAAAQPQT
jgi:alkylation response protein AidB-like acyl-CoA dehydrogenase